MPTPLVDWLRVQDDDTLADLLRLRPDLAVPPTDPSWTDVNVNGAPGRQRTAVYTDQGTRVCLLAWPELPDGEHPVTELTTDVQGPLSPFGEMEFPLPEVPYVHPHTVVNR